MAASAMAQEIYSGVQKRTEYVLSLIASSRTDPNKPAAPLDLRDAVRNCLQLRDYLTDSVLLAWKDALDTEIDDYNLSGKLVLLCFDAALKTFRAVQNALDTAKGEGRARAIDGHFEEEIAKFRETILAVESVRADFENRWPWCDESRLLESIAAHRRGEPSKVAREAFREIRSRIQGRGH